MSINYKKHEMFPDYILMRDFSGSVNIDNIIESWEYIKEHDLVTDKIKGIINNLSDCELQLNMYGFKTLISYLRQQNHLKGIKLAVICDSPDKIVFPTLGENIEKELMIKPFSTVDAAVNWIILNT